MPNETGAAIFIFKLPPTRNWEAIATTTNRRAAAFAQLNVVSAKRKTKKWTKQTYQPQKPYCALLSKNYLVFIMQEEVSRWIRAEWWKYRG